MIVCPFGFDVDRRRPTYPLNRSAKPDVLQSCAKSRAQTRTLAKRDSMCSEIPSELFHPKGNSVAVVMPLTKVDGDTERKRQRRAASPSERGRRSERAPWSKARDANRKRLERAPSRTSSADATGQALSKKARALARIRPLVYSFARLLRR